jgi:hypothetical protein
MAGFVTVKTDMFFDRKSVVDKMDEKERRVLSRVGAYGRGAVRKSIRKQGKKASTAHSKPGTPPRWRARGRESLKDRIFFGFDDRASASVVIGPEKFNSTGRGVRLVGRSTVPELLEKGGVRIVLTRYAKGRKLPKAKHVRQLYRPRPYVGSTTSAFKNTAAKMRELMETLPL